MSTLEHPSVPTTSLNPGDAKNSSAQTNSNTTYVELWNRYMGPLATLPSLDSVPPGDRKSLSINPDQSPLRLSQRPCRVSKRRPGPPKQLTPTASTKVSRSAAQSHPENRINWQTKYSAKNPAFYCRQDTLLCAITCPKSDISHLRLEDQIWVQNYRNKNDPSNTNSQPLNHLEETASYIHKHQLATQLYQASCFGSKAAFAALPSELRPFVDVVKDNRTTLYESGLYNPEGAEWATKADCWDIVDGAVGSGALAPDV